MMQEGKTGNRREAIKNNMTVLWNKYSAFEEEKEEDTMSIEAPPGLIAKPKPVSRNRLKKQRHKANKDISKLQKQEDWEEHQIMTEQAEKIRNEDPEKKLARRQNYEQAMKEIAEGHAQYERESADREWESMKSAGQKEVENIINLLKIRYKKAYRQ